MYAMQYEITLPADYDMGIIRDRVAGRGRLTDAYEGLGFKAYLVRERGTDGSPVNQYAPFYLWGDTAGMNRFLWGGGGFGGIVGDFGRPGVHHWTGAAFRPGPAHGSAPRAASRLRERLPEGADPREPVARALRRWEERCTAPGVHAALLAVDPRHWEIVQLTLWEDAVAGDDPDRYALLHLSAPHWRDLPVGSRWPRD
ncbi:DUF4865 family protein [Streptomyces sp. NPDC088732]|uniref:DUF4865 family protein n=1 Tax=Streptomyces sp. NPDC088732 TaxID=3365879 RepID=UPI00381ED9FE